MSEADLQTLTPFSVQVCYDIYMQLVKEHKWKVINADPSLPSIQFKVGSFKVEANFHLLSEKKTDVRLFVRFGGMADCTDAATTSFMIPFNARVNARLEGEAKTLLAGTSRDALLHLDQPVPEPVGKLLQDLQQNLSVYSRRDAARALAKLPESNERIVGALLLASETDPHADLRAEAMEALRAPVHQAILGRDASWAEQVVALTRVGQVEQRRKEQKVQETGVVGRRVQRSGIIVILVGAFALLAPLAGGQLMLWGFIPTGHPLVAGSILVIGIAMVLWGSRSQ